ncbi:unnamed protein product (macronuclear) [Paramecium tetraurelia]|uniref:FCP1 homology domain-containing protein n=1 Tax=Paramecium tetraurelia TaxID=5888 RepID=A0BT20_PARTE|nr:uncharacterized protein GSPATT00031919001 [Paramecium tetraurelia]CAK61687.1 unnamed protein product [Paramecium tetraurelia]|eukprot:XP_001429085.1 hypothetical protein (macronuclear) [Paramecium tetraurelia strain d4-2]
MIAQKIEGHFLRTVQAQNYSQNNMKFIEQVSSQLICIQSDTFCQVNEEASELCQINKQTNNSMLKKQAQQNGTQISGPKETYQRGHEAQNDSQTVTPLAIPEVQDLEEIPSLEDNLIPVQNTKKCCLSNNFFSKQRVIRRKLIRKRFKTSRQSTIAMDSNNSLPTALDLQLEGQGAKQSGTNNKQQQDNQKQNHESKGESNDVEIMKYIRIEDFNQPKNRNVYYTDKLINLIKGEQVDTFMAQMYINHFIQTYEILQKSKMLKQSETYQILPKIKPQTTRQKTLVIDLDETLVHCNESCLMPKDLEININLNNGFIVKVIVRPYTQQFLQNMSKHFEIMIYTASNEDYANQIIDYLDPTKQLVKYRLYRNDCINLSKGCHVKDLRSLNRNLEDIILIDNSAYSFAYQLSNGIPIIPYLDNKKDNELIELESYLMDLLKVDDIRIENERSFHFKQMQSSSTIQQAVNHLICNRR